MWRMADIKLSAPQNTDPASAIPSTTKWNYWSSSTTYIDKPWSLCPPLAWSCLRSTSRSSLPSYDISLIVSFILRLNHNPIVVVITIIITHINHSGQKIRRLRIQNFIQSSYSSKGETMEYKKIVLNKTFDGKKYTTSYYNWVNRELRKGVVGDGVVQWILREI